MLRRLVRMYKTIKANNEAQLKLNTSLVVPEQRELNGIVYFNSDLHVKAFGAKYAFTAKNLFGQLIIFTDDDFETLPEDVRLFTLYHELGHVENGDLERPAEELQKVLRERNRKSVNEMELKADEYAVRKTSIETALKSMELFKKTVKEMGLPTKEVKQRIKYIKNLNK